MGEISIAVSTQEHEMDVRGWYYTRKTEKKHKNTRENEENYEPRAWLEKFDLEPEPACCTEIKVREIQICSLVFSYFITLSPTVLIKSMACAA